MQFISILIIVFLIKRYVCSDIEEIFGIGEPIFNNVNMVGTKYFLKRKDVISFFFWEMICIYLPQWFQENTFWKNPSYSTEDLLLLWQFENTFLKKELLQQRSTSNETKFNKMIKDYLNYIDYDL